MGKGGNVFQPSVLTKGRKWLFVSDQMLIDNCAPTLAGLKTANLFSCSYESEEELRDSLRRLNRCLSRKGLRVLPLRRRNGRALIYVYRPAFLQRDLEQEGACRMLSERGYCGGQNRCLRLLMKKLCEEREFPHEIGLFLGYPPEDVCGFIENKAAGCKCVGCWKVYGDADAAKRIFRRYQKCTEAYQTFWERGVSLETLAVTV